MGVAGIYKRGGVYWFRTDPLSGGRASSGKKDRKAAELEYRARERLAANPADAAADQATLGEWAQHMVASKHRHRAKRTAEYYAQKIGHWIRIFGADAPLSAITPQSTMAFLDQRRAEGAAELTLDKELVAITQTLKLAHHAGVYGRDPSSLRPPEFTADYKPRTRFLTHEEAVELLRALPPRRAAHVAFFLATGARLSEAARAEVGDIDWESGTVFLRGTKTKAARRHVPILRHTVDMLRAAEEWLPFATWTNIRRDLTDACARAGIATVTANDLRRTTATWLVEAGVSFDLIAKVLGHTSTQMLHKVYGQPRTFALGKLIDAQYTTAPPSQGGTDPSQSTPAVEATDSGNPAKATLAQLVEQRFRKPAPWAELIGEIPDYAGKVASSGPADAAQCRPSLYNNGTVLLPPVEAARKALEALGSTEDPVRVAAALIEGRRARGRRPADALLEAARVAQSGDADAEPRVHALLSEVAAELAEDER